MNKFKILSFLILILIGFAKNGFSISLVEVNTQWRHQQELSIFQSIYTPQSEHDAIRGHLQFVEFLLRNRNVSNLNIKQQANREKCLTFLHEYWNEGNFPVNNISNHRTPIFIDQDNNFCAVGYLMKRSGNEKLARSIQSKNNFIYVKEIKDIETLNWIEESGLSVDECAWVQPSYGNPTQFNTCGYGTNGTIYGLKTINNALYVGGDFTKVDSVINSNGLAKLIKSGSSYNWQDISQGLPQMHLNGNFVPTLQIKAIDTFDNKLFVGGVYRDYGNAINYESVYYYDGTQFKKCDGVFGPVHDFEVYNGKLYMSGLFKLGTSNYASLAHWDVSTQKWVYDFVVYTTASPIYKMTKFENKLILGGSFMNLQNSKNVLAFDGTVTYPLYTGLENEVYALAVFNNRLYAAGKINGLTSSYSMKYFNGTNWVDTNNLYLPYANRINTLYATSSNLFWGGDFKNYGMMFSAANLMCTNGPQGWGMMDTSVNVIEEFDGKIFVGGQFKYPYLTNGSFNHITYIDNMPSSILEVEDIEMSIFPNPASDYLIINNFKPNTSYLIYNISGSNISKGSFVSNRIDISQLNRGIYFLSIQLKDNSTKRLKFVKN